MATNFIIKALDYEDFAGLFELSDAELQKNGAMRVVVDEKPGYPCRVCLEDAEVGEEVLLLNYEHHKINSPFKNNGPIFVRRNVKKAVLRENEIPKMLDHRLLSLRGYDANGLMQSALVIEGKDIRQHINELFENKDISYIHIHNARPGCYNCTVERV